MEGHWIKLPARDVYVVLPLGIFDKDIELLFKTPEAIDSAIEQLQQIRGNYTDFNGDIIKVKE